MAHHATPDMADRFWSRVPSREPGECWEWAGPRQTGGYGQFYIGMVQGRTRRGMAHRIAYELTFGLVPDDKQIDHLCRNTACVNPSHLEIVTPRENQMRSTSQSAANARKTHCKRGHEFTPENTQRTASRPNKRVCATCRKIRRRAVAA